MFCGEQDRAVNADDARTSITARHASHVSPSDTDGCLKEAPEADQPNGNKDDALSFHDIILLSLEGMRLIPSRMITSILQQSSEQMIRQQSQHQISKSRGDYSGLPFIRGAIFMIHQEQFCCEIEEKLSLTGRQKLIHRKCNDHPKNWASGC